MIGKIAPETAKKTIAITKLLQESCHSCGHAKNERCFGRVVKAPDVDNETCKQCITDKENQIFGESTKC